MELNEEEKKAIEDSKELINDLKKCKDKDFIGRLYYKNRPIEDTLMLLLNIIERQQEEIDTWEETENDYEHELARNNEQIKRQQKEIEENREALDFSNNEIIELKDMLIEKDKKIKDLSKYVYDKDFISKDKIREKIKELEDNMVLFTNDKEKFNRYKYARDILEKTLGE